MISNIFIRFILIFVTPFVLWLLILFHDASDHSPSELFLLGNFAIAGAAVLLSLTKLCTHRTKVTTLFLTIVSSIAFVFAVSNGKDAHYIAISLVLSCFFLFLSSILLEKYFNLVSIVLIFVLTTIVSVFGEYTTRFGKIGNDTYAAILQSDVFEVVFYVAEFFEWWPILAFGAATVAYFSGKSFIGSLESPPSPLTFTLVLVPIASLLMVTSTPLLRKSYEQFQHLPSSLQAFYTQRQLERQVFHKLESMLATTGQVPGPRFPGNVIVIMGESVTRHHMSLYGYHRATTPRLDAIADELLVFSDVVSPFSSTVPALLTALTPAYYNFGGADNATFYQHYENNLLIAARRNGLHTTWISNQIQYGLYEIPTSALAKFANETVFTSTPVGNFSEVFRINESRTDSDRTMIAELRKTLDSQPQSNLIFLHMDAVHIPYCRHATDEHIDELNRNSPLGKSFFGDSKDFSERTTCYDAGIRGVDGFVRDVVEIASKLATPTIVFYFSDHGEAPTLGTGHDSAQHSHYHNEVPFLFYFNQSGREYFWQEIEAARSNLEKPILLSTIYESLLDLIDMEVSFDPNRSVFNQEYQSPARILNDERPVYYDSLEGDDSKDTYEKFRIILAEVRKNNEELWRRIWAHRVNSIGKLLEAKQLFAGVEVDIVFDGKVFLVNHPPKELVGLTLEQWLNATQDRTDLQFWFAWKDLDPKSFKMAKERLEYLNRQFNIKKRSVVETGPTAVFLELAELTRSDWRHAYYLPPDEIENCLSLDNRSVCDRTAATVVAAIDKIGATAVSYDFKQKAFVDKYRDELRNLILLSRHPGIPDDSMLTKDFEKELIANNVVLVPFRTYFAQ